MRPRYVYAPQFTGHGTRAELSNLTRFNISNGGHQVCEHFYNHNSCPLSQLNHIHFLKLVILKIAVEKYFVNSRKSVQ